MSDFFPSSCVFRIFSLFIPSLHIWLSGCGPRLVCNGMYEAAVAQRAERQKNKQKKQQQQFVVPVFYVFILRLSSVPNKKKTAATTTTRILLALSLSLRLCAREPHHQFLSTKKDKIKNNNNKKK
eukprot:gene858-493_t